MYAALLNSTLVLAISEAQLVRTGKKALNQSAYQCPNCGGRVLLSVASKQAFFRHHRSLTTGGGEKAEHHGLKLTLLAALVANGFPAKTEVVLAGGAIRADVLVHSQLAFEIQCAPLGLAEYRQRHQCYQQEQIRDIWIVGRRHFLQSKIKASQCQYFRYAPGWGDYYLEADYARQRLCLSYQVHQAPISRHLYYFRAYFALDDQGLAALWQFQPAEQPVAFSASREQAYLRQQIQQRTRLGQEIAAALYQAGLTVTDLPDQLFRHSRRPGTRNPVLQWLDTKKHSLQ